MWSGWPRPVFDVVLAGRHCRATIHPGLDDPLEGGAPLRGDDDPSTMHRMLTWLYLNRPAVGGGEVAALLGGRRCLRMAIEYNYATPADATFRSTLFAFATLSPDMCRIDRVDGGADGAKAGAELPPTHYTLAASWAATVARRALARMNPSNLSRSSWCWLLSAETNSSSRLMAGLSWCYFCSVYETRRAL